MSTMSIVVLLLMAAAVILLAIATFLNPVATNPPNYSRFRFGWAGLLCWAFAELLMHVGK
jgi:hypothetical protein